MVQVRESVPNAALDTLSPDIAHLPEDAPANGHANGADSDSGADLRNLLNALQAVRVGDFSVRLPVDQTGLIGKISDVFNDIVAANERMAQQLEHVGEMVGREGKTRHRVKFGLSHGSWGDMETSVNTLIDDL